MSMSNLGNKKNIKITIGIIILILVMSSITIYSNVIKPKKYDEYMNIGNKYLEDGKYEEAILAFNKAIKIDTKNTKVRVTLAKAYVGKNDTSKAVDILKEVQNMDTDNEKLLIEILDIIKDIDGDIAYEIMQDYIDKVGKDNISQEIKDILETENELPQIPNINPKPGTYSNPIAIKLELDKIKIGHSFYYTTDGSDPTKESQKYSGIIEVDKDTEIKLIGYNKKDDVTDVVSLKYIIDEKMKAELEKAINEAEDLHNKAKEGTEEGEFKKGAKDILLKEIEKSKIDFNNSSIEKEEVDKSVNMLRGAIDNFQKSKNITFDVNVALKYLADEYGSPTRELGETPRMDRLEIFDSPYYTMQKEGNLNYFEIHRQEVKFPSNIVKTYKVYENGKIVLKETKQIN